MNRKLFHSNAYRHRKTQNHLHIPVSHLEQIETSGAPPAKKNSSFLNMQPKNYADQQNFQIVDKAITLCRGYVLSLVKRKQEAEHNSSKIKSCIRLSQAKLVGYTLSQSPKLTPLGKVVSWQILKTDKAEGSSWKIIAEELSGCNRPGKSSFNIWW